MRIVTIPHDRISMAVIVKKIPAENGLLKRENGYTQLLFYLQKNGCGYKRPVMRNGTTPACPSSSVWGYAAVVTLSSCGAQSQHGQKR